MNTKVDWLESILRRDAIMHGTRAHPRVMVLTYVDGTKLLLKVVKDPSLLAGEVAALEDLRCHGAAVPQVIDYDSQGILILEYIPGTTWGNLDLSHLHGLCNDLLVAWQKLQYAWTMSRPQLESLSYSYLPTQFSDEMQVLGNWLCPQAPDVKGAFCAWEQIIKLATAVPLSFGSLDYNPHNILWSRAGFTFIDFESFGLDWDYRRLWQYTTIIKNGSGQSCWYPALRSFLYKKPQADAHYILFAAQAVRKNPELLKMFVPKIWDAFGSDHAATRGWRQAWDIHSVKQGNHTCFWKGVNSMGFQPRERDLVIGDIPWLARMIDKARAKADGTIEDYIYPCPDDRKLLGKLGMTGAEFSAIVAESPTDEDVIAKVKPKYKA